MTTTGTMGGRNARDDPAHRGGARIGAVDRRSAGTDIAGARTDRPEGEQDEKRLLEESVIERTKKLGHEERTEPARCEQGEL